MKGRNKMFCDERKKKKSDHEGKKTKCFPLKGRKICSVMKRRKKVTIKGR